MAEVLQAPFPWFGGKRKAADTVWPAFGVVDNYVEPFADWPVNEVDLCARHSWLVRQRAGLTEQLHADPAYYDARIAGWWVWGSCAWIGSGWCSGTGPWVHDGERIVRADSNAGQGINRKLPHLGDAGQGINRQLPHLGDAGKGSEHPRTAFIRDWMRDLHERLRDVRVTCGDWRRVCQDSITTRHGLTAIFLDPPYEKGEMDYSAGGMGLGIANAVRDWCAANGHNPQLRIVLCGHAGEHGALLAQGWHTRSWKAGSGYALTDEAVANRKSETLWCSPHCVPERGVVQDLFAEVANG